MCVQAPENNHTLCIDTKEMQNWYGTFIYLCCMIFVWVWVCVWSTLLPSCLNAICQLLNDVLIYLMQDFINSMHQDGGCAWYMLKFLCNF